ncbi:sensor histidine kinase, partial [Amycolatopsis sp. NPDC000673]
MDPTLAARALSAATEITSTALSGDDPEAVLETVVARAVELADADLGLAMVSADDGRVVVEAAYGVDGLLAEAPAGDVEGGPVGELRGLTLETDS